jgi:hypothetical protein
LKRLSSMAVALATFPSFSAFDILVSFILFYLVCTV